MDLTGGAGPKTTLLLFLLRELAERAGVSFDTGFRFFNELFEACADALLADEEFVTKFGKILFFLIAVSDALDAAAKTWTT